MTVADQGADAQTSVRQFFNRGERQARDVDERIGLLDVFAHQVDQVCSAAEELRVGCFARGSSGLLADHLPERTRNFSFAELLQGLMDRIRDSDVSAAAAEISAHALLDFGIRKFDVRFSARSVRDRTWRSALKLADHPYG